MHILPGHQLANEIFLKLKYDIEQNNVKPRLAIIQIGQEEASNIYISKKIAAGREIGIEIDTFKYSAENSEVITAKIQSLNEDPETHGIIIQLPTPGMEIFRILNSVKPSKDVDGLTEENLGRIWYGLDPTHIGATPKAIMHALNYIASTKAVPAPEFFKGKNVLVINHNILIGKPVAGLLLRNNSTVTIAHSETKNMSDFFPDADIIITATGKRIITTENSSKLKQDVIIIDSGYAREKGRSYGDVDPEAVACKASWLSPVPGGIGPLGVAMLMQNTYIACMIQKGNII